MGMSMKSVNLAELGSQYRGSRFYQLVEHHLRCQSQDQRTQGLQETVALLPEIARGLVEGFIDQCNARTHNRDFWQRDTASVFDEIINDARSVLRPVGLENNDEAAFNLFNIVVLNYAYSAYDQPKMREFMGIVESGFPWPSLVALLYPLGATIYIATTPASPVMVVGYGLANLSYLLFAAGIWSGSFRILGLKNRQQVFGAAGMSFILGIVLSNVGA